MKAIVIIFFVFLSLNIFKAENTNANQIEIYKNIRCLICQGQSIADSNSDFAQTIKLIVQEQLNEGKSDKQIYSFLTEKYGEWIVYKPPFNKHNFLLWILPYLIFFVFQKKKHK